MNDRLVHLMFEDRLYCWNRLDLLGTHRKAPRSRTVNPSREQIMMSHSEGAWAVITLDPLAYSSLVSWKHHCVVWRE